MDTFTEQLVTIKKDGKAIALQIFIWVLAAALSFGMFLLSGIIRPLAYALFLIVFLIFFGAYKLSLNLNVEFEYIVTNGDVDVDSIIAKSKRRRVVSFKCAKIEKVEPVKGKIVRDKETYICNDPTADSYKVTFTSENGGRKAVIISPDSRTIEAIKKSMPYLVKQNAFTRN